MFTMAWSMTSDSVLNYIKKYMLRPTYHLKIAWDSMYYHLKYAPISLNMSKALQKMHFMKTILINTFYVYMSNFFCGDLLAMVHDNSSSSLKVIFLLIPSCQFYPVPLAWFSKVRSVFLECSFPKVRFHKPKAQKSVGEASGDLAGIS